MTGQPTMHACGAIAGTSWHDPLCGVQEASAMSAGGPGIGDWQSMAEQAVWDMNSARGRIEPIVLNPDKSYAIEWLKAAEADLTSARHKLVQAILMAEGGRV